MEITKDADYLGSTLKGLYDSNDVFWPNSAVVSTPEFFAVSAHHSMGASELITLGMSLGQMLWYSVDNYQYPELDDAVKKRLNSRLNSFYKINKVDIFTSCEKKCFVPIYSGTSYMLSVLRRNDVLSLRDNIRKRLEVDSDTAIDEIVRSYAVGIEDGLESVSRMVPRYVV
jgi:hypothetical protein